MNCQKSMFHLSFLQLLAAGALLLNMLMCSDSLYSACVGGKCSETGAAQFYDASNHGGPGKDFMNLNAHNYKSDPEWNASVVGMNPVTPPNQPYNLPAIGLSLNCDTCTGVKCGMGTSEFLAADQCINGDPRTFPPANFCAGTNGCGIEASWNAEADYNENSCTPDF